MHRLVVQVAGVREDAELITREWRLGEDVGQHVAEAAHAPSLGQERAEPAGGSILHVVRLFLVRHAEAASGEPDELRPLTPAGREQARELGERLAPVAPAVVLSSPL
ncbi:MAG: histidine phosphatase family protein, partial [Actinobacteria bacterium]|nr:histidine phosphatase family protein [Actinomycetota bacterium]